jgi:hypothetical protein
MAITRNGALGLLGLVLACSSAQADLSISSKPTQNMDCQAGVCTATAQKAILNVDDLTAMLAAGDLIVKTGGGAITIQVLDGFSWTSTNRLTLDAQRSVVFRQPVTVAGAGEVTIAYSGDRGDLFFFDKGKIYFANLNSDLVINDVHYMLVSDLSTLAKDVANNPAGAFALAAGYDASTNGVYPNCPIPEFKGRLEGLGHHIGGLQTKVHQAPNGLFCRISGAVVRDLALQDVSVIGGTYVGALAGYAIEGASIVAVSVSGKIKGGIAGGIVGYVAGNVSRSHSDANVLARAAAGHGGGEGGGLVGYMETGAIDQSFSTGMVSGGERAGGLAAIFYLATKISNSYARGTIDGGETGGLASGSCSALENSYSSAEVKAFGGGGGLLFENSYASCNGTIHQGYWDLDKRAQGCFDGDCSGAVGLTDAQLKSGLPDGFDPNIWGSDPKINNGYPYLLGNPPQ